MARKIEAMHDLYGRAPGICGDCDHFSIQCWRSRSYFKCEAYSTSCSEASDWRKHYIACGLLNKPLPDDFQPVLDWLKRQPRLKADEVVPGQMRMEV